MSENSGQPANPSRDTLCATKVPERAQVPPPEPLFQAHVSIRNTELSVHWTRYNILSAVNYGLLGVALVRSDSLIGAYAVMAPLGGVLLGTVWLLITIMGKELLRARDANIVAYEERFPEELRLFSNIVKGHEAGGWVRRNWNNINLLAWSLPALCILAWLFIMITRLTSG